MSQTQCEPAGEKFDKKYFFFARRIVPTLAYFMGSKALVPAIPRHETRRKDACHEEQQEIEVNPNPPPNGFRRHFALGSGESPPGYF
jgi:hypothetical protein